MAEKKPEFAIITPLTERADVGLTGMSLLSASEEPIGQCPNCRWYNGGQECDAYPLGIEDAIFEGAILHDTPLPGDHGLRYEPKHQRAPHEEV